MDDLEKREGMKKIGTEKLRDGIKYYLAAHGCDAFDESLVPKIGNFLLALTSIEPTIPLKGKRLRDLSAKQRILFQSNEYEGTTDGEFLGNWIDDDAYFLFSRRTVKVVTRGLLKPSPHHKILARLCHKRPDPVIAYERLSMAVPRFLRDMQGKMKFMSIDDSYRFENAEKPKKDGRWWIRTEPVNVLLSILDHQDVQVHLGNGFVVIYNRWFGAYFKGE